MELERRPEDQLSLKEFVAVRVHTVVRAMREEIEKTRKKLEDSQVWKALEPYPSPSVLVVLRRPGALKLWGSCMILTS